MVQKCTLEDLEALLALLRRFFPCTFQEMTKNILKYFHESEPNVESYSQSASSHS